MSVLAASLLLAAMSTSTTNYAQRAKDWRFGPVVYQIFPDRFAPSKSLEAKKHLYAAPRRLRAWSETPTGGTFDAKAGNWTHELDFWGGDLASISANLEYVSTLGADVVYFNPIQEAFTNHKYDTSDYYKIAPEFGTNAEFKALIGQIHKQKMKVMLDGVFNHMGKRAPLFADAFADPKNENRDWFRFGKEYPLGYSAWVGAANLPEFNLENPEVRDYLWKGQKSVVRHYLREGIDGWRLDVAFELGPDYLDELTKAAHKTARNSAVIGEIAGYPAEWFPMVDGVFNGFAISVAHEAVQGNVSGGRAGRMLATMVEDAGIENILRSWLIIDNHDTPRIASVVPDWKDRRLLFAMLFTLPGAPCVYYGTELGMTGDGDPVNRAPMRWDLNTPANETLTWTKQLIQLRRKFLALRYGDFKVLETEKLLAFVRHTDKIGETVLVAMNPTNDLVKETFSTRMGRVLSWGEMEDVLSKKRVRSITGMATLEMAPKSVAVFRVVTEPNRGHTFYKRID
jgi:cyclomaltodextrinase / maltogenic alpha-amylase / neopullulanase